MRLSALSSLTGGLALSTVSWYSVTSEQSLPARDTASAAVRGTESVPSRVTISVESCRTVEPVKRMVGQNSGYGF